MCTYLRPPEFSPQIAQVHGHVDRDPWARWRDESLPTHVTQWVGEQGHQYYLNELSCCLPLSVLLGFFWPFIVEIVKEMAFCYFSLVECSQVYDNGGAPSPTQDTPGRLPGGVVAHTRSSRVRESRSGYSGTRGHTGHFQQREQRWNDGFYQEITKNVALIVSRERSREWQEMGLMREAQAQIM